MAGVGIAAALVNSGAVEVAAIVDIPATLVAVLTLVGVGGDVELQAIVPKSMKWSSRTSPLTRFRSTSPP